MVNEQIKTMILEDGHREKKDFINAVQYFPNISISLITGKQSEALDFIAREPVDAVILDLELEEGDGLTFLDLLKEELLISPFVIVTTNNESMIISERVKNSGADFVFHKSNEAYSAEYILSFIMKTAKYFVSVEMQRERLRNEIMLETQIEKLYRLEVDRRMGYLKIYTNYRGMILARDAILLVLMSKSAVKLQVKELYITLGQKYKISHMNVERNIRTWLERSWGNADEYSVREYYGGDIDPEKGKPTNREFIFQLAKQVIKTTKNDMMNVEIMQKINENNEKSDIF